MTDWSFHTDPPIDFGVSSLPDPGDERDEREWKFHEDPLDVEPFFQALMAGLRDPEEDSVKESRQIVNEWGRSSLVKWNSELQKMGFEINPQHQVDDRYYTISSPRSVSAKVMLPYVVAVFGFAGESVRVRGSAIMARPDPTFFQRARASLPNALGGQEVDRRFREVGQISVKENLIHMEKRELNEVAESNALALLEKADPLVVRTVLI